jgi:predicted Rdx family selenoprotein
VPLNSDETGGRFRVWLSLEGIPDKPDLVWDRKVEGGFPELKVLVCGILNAGMIYTMLSLVLFKRNSALEIV